MSAFWLTAEYPNHIEADWYPFRLLTTNDKLPPSTAWKCPFYLC